MSTTTLAEAIAAGDRRGALVAMRDPLVDAFTTTRSARDKATLSRRIQELGADIDKLDELAEAEDDPTMPDPVTTSAAVGDEPFDPSVI